MTDADPRWLRRLNELEDRADPDAEPTPAAIPCVDCGTPSAKSPCPRCGRFKW